MKPINETSFLDYYFLRIIRWTVRQVMECLWMLVYAWRIRSRDLPDDPKSIFILRNNDMGDVLIVTPLFEALHRRFPKAKIYVGVGSWSKDLLKENPHATEVEVNAPWYNKVLPKQGFISKLAYLSSSQEMKTLKNHHFDIGIDILGSHWGMLLLLGIGAKFRMSVRGYAGGFGAAHRSVEHTPHLHVSEQALGFAKMFGVSNLPACRPQIYLTSQEKEQGESVWGEVFGLRGKRIVMAPGGGRKNKCWPESHYLELAKKLSTKRGSQILVVGGKQDHSLGEQLAEVSESVQSRCGNLSLRDTFGIVDSADIVICNSSLVMHASAAFSKPTFVMLGEFFGSAQQHQKQWGYEGISRCLGKENEKRHHIFTPDEVFELITKHLRENI